MCFKFYKINLEQLIKTFSFFVLLFVLMGCNNNLQKNKFKLQNGDLLFQNTGTDSIDKAIKDVTATSFSKNYSHIGIAFKEANKWFVLEAIPKKGICQTPLNSFLDRYKNKYNKSQTTVARLDSIYKPYISKAIVYGLERLNAPYDNIFLWDNSSYYCSELIYKMFSSQDLGKNPVPFLTHAMTFKDASNNTMASWVNYYKELKHPIPEGIKGTNPNLIAGSTYLTFVHDYEK